MWGVMVFRKSGNEIYFLRKVFIKSRNVIRAGNESR